MHNMHTTRSYHSSTTRVVCVHTIDSCNIRVVHYARIISMHELVVLLLYNILYYRVLVHHVIIIIL